MSVHVRKLARVTRRAPSVRCRRRDRPAALRALLEGVDRAALVDDDPVALVHRYRDPHDQEVAGLLVAALAYGRVRSIKDAAERALARLGPRPAQSLERGGPAALEGFVYRFQRGEDLPRFLGAIGALRARHGSLAAAFASSTDPDEPDLAGAAARFVGALRAEMRAFDPGRPLSNGLRYLVPDPGSGGAAKRLWLYLRWMIRRADGLDPGTWARLRPDLRPAGLLVPLDTHLARIARYLELTRRRADDLITAREITTALAAVDPDDPVRFDMALCHLGISGACPPALDLARCGPCVLSPTCGRRR